MQHLKLHNKNLGRTRKDTEGMEEGYNYIYVIIKKYTFKRNRN